jgi:hypothetical protein
MRATVGMYRDLKGMAGKTLQKFEGLNPIALVVPDISKEDRNVGGE